ncbi:MAG: DUF4340 domain-containing protein [Bryobacterales bacterium]|nr:DUF4340 domain-containing protein [Bryobacterales bacterium]
MKPRRLLIAVVVLAALAGAIYWSEKHKPAGEKAPGDTGPKITAIQSDQIRQIEIKRKDGENTVLRKNNGTWEMTSPAPLRVDQEAANSLAGTFNNLSADRLVDQQTNDLTQYGLASPATQVIVTENNGKTVDLQIGDEVPTGSGYFAKLGGDPRIFSLASFNKTSLDKNAKDLQDKRLLTFDQDKLSRVEVTAKKQTFEFGKNNQNEWQIVKPRPLRADGGQVEDLIRKLHDAKMDTSVSDEDARKAAAQFATATPVAVVKVTDAGGTQQLDVRKAKDNSYYARSSVVEGVHKVTSDVGDGLDKGLDDYRNKKVFDFGFNDPTKVDVRDGAKTLSFVKGGEKWWLAGKQMDSTDVQSLIDKLRDLSATKFADKPLGQPEIDLTVTSNDGKRVEKVALAKQGNDWFAKRENEPSLYQLETSSVEELRKAAESVKEYKPPKAETKKK